MLRSINKRVLTVLSVSVLTVIAVRCTADTSTKTNEQQNAAMATSESGVSIERGQHLVIGGACHDCHSPKIMTPTGPRVDSSRILSGHPADAPLPAIDLKALQPDDWIHFSPDLTAFIGPWGMSFAANLTSDSATGIGAWSESNFVGAIRKGKHMGFDNGRPISPPMPWDNYKNLSDDDLKSIFAYLKSTLPVSNRVHEPYSPDEVRAMAKQQK